MAEELAGAALRGPGHHFFGFAVLFAEGAFFSSFFFFPEATISGGWNMNRATPELVVWIGLGVGTLGFCRGELGNH